MAENVNIRFDGDATALLKAYDEVEQENRKLKDELKQTGDTSEQASGRMGQGMVAFKATVDLARDAIQLLNSEWEKQIRNEQEATSAAVDFGQALRDIAQNLPADKLPSEMPAFESAMLGIAGRTGADPSAIVRAAGSAYSARGALSEETTQATIEAAFALNPRNEAQSNIVTSMALDLMKSGDVDDPRAAIGFISNMQQALRLEDVADMDRAFRGMTNIAQLPGNTREEAMEMLATIQQVMGDKTGSTATGVVNMANRMMQYEGFEGDSLARIAQAQANPQLREAFIADTAWDAETGNVLKAWLRGDPAVMQAFSAAQATINPLDARQTLTYEDLLARRRGSTVDDVVQRNAANEVARLQFDIADPGRQIRGEAIDVFEGVLDDVDLPGNDDWAKRIMMADANAHGKDPAYMAGRLRSVATNWWESFPFGMMHEDDNARFLEAATRLDAAASALERANNQPPSAPVAIQRDRELEGR